MPYQILTLPVFSIDVGIVILFFWKGYLLIVKIDKINFGKILRPGFSFSWILIACSYSYLDVKTRSEYLFIFFSFLN